MSLRAQLLALRLSAATRTVARPSKPPKMVRPIPLLVQPLQMSPTAAARSPPAAIAPKMLSNSKYNVPRAAVAVPLVSPMRSSLGPTSCRLPWRVQSIQCACGARSSERPTGSVRAADSYFGELTGDSHSSGGTMAQ